MASPEPVETATRITAGELGMQAQAALLPYALAAFGICLPVFVWVGSHAANAVWMSACFTTFAVGCAAFYGTVDWLKGAGQFSFLEKMSDADWERMRPKK